MKLTESELNAEWEVHYHTRLGNMCGAAKPTEEQDKLARDEADEHVLALVRIV